MRISDWSSDVCSSDLADDGTRQARIAQCPRGVDNAAAFVLGALAQRTGALCTVAGTGVREHPAQFTALAQRPADFDQSSEERRVGKECVSTWRSRWSR